VCTRKSPRHHWATPSPTPPAAHVRTAPVPVTRSTTPQGLTHLSHTRNALPSPLSLPKPTDAPPRVSPPDPVRPCSKARRPRTVHPTTLCARLPLCSRALARCMSATINPATNTSRQTHVRVVRGVHVARASSQLCAHPSTPAPRGAAIPLSTHRSRICTQRGPPRAPPIEQQLKQRQERRAPKLKRGGCSTPQRPLYSPHPPLAAITPQPAGSPHIFIRQPTSRPLVSLFGYTPFCPSGRGAPTPGWPGSRNSDR